MQNHVNEIRSLVSFDCWYHCPGEDNPADMPSRGIDLSLLISSTLWLMGPNKICDPEFEPQCPDPRLPPEKCLSEMRVKDRLACSNLLTQGLHQGGAIIDCERFSTLRKLLKVTTYVMKFVSLLKSKVRKSDPVTRTITAVDVENAELFWVRLSHRMNGLEFGNSNLDWTVVMMVSGDAREGYTMLIFLKLEDIQSYLTEDITSLC